MHPTCYAKHHVFATTASFAIHLVYFVHDVIVKKSTFSDPRRANLSYYLCSIFLCMKRILLKLEKHFFLLKYRPFFPHTHICIYIYVCLCIIFRSPLSGSDTQCKITERTSYYPQEPNKRPQTRQEKVRSCLKHNSLTILTVTGVFGGVVLGIILRSLRTQGWTPREIMYINYIGDLFLRMLKSLILPLIISSLVSAIGSLDLSLSGKIGVRAIVYYMVTTISAVVLGRSRSRHLSSYFLKVNK